MSPKERALAIWRQGTQPVISVAIWAVIILLCAFSATDLKGFVESVGDLGPVIVAWLVYQLGRQQHLTQSHAAQQAVRLQLLATRLESRRKLAEVWSATRKDGADLRKQLAAFKVYLDEAAALFDDTSIEPLRNAGEQLKLAHWAKNEKGLAAKFAPDGVAAYLDRFEKLVFTAHDMMAAEMRVLRPLSESHADGND